MDKKEIRQTIRDEFEYYLSNVAKSSRITAKGYNLQSTAVGSYLSFIETDKLFDYNPSKWSHIESMYDITEPEEVDSIVQSLLADPAFAVRDKSNNQGIIRVLSKLAPTLVALKKRKHQLPLMIRQYPNYLQSTVRSCLHFGNMRNTSGRL